MPEHQESQLRASKQSVRDLCRSRAGWERGEGAGRKAQGGRGGGHSSPVYERQDISIHLFAKRYSTPPNPIKVASASALESSVRDLSAGELNRWGGGGESIFLET